MKKNMLLGKILGDLENLINDRKRNPQESSYTNKLLKNDIDKIVQKVGEEAIEVVIASMQKEKLKILEERADLIFHLCVIWSYYEISQDDIAKILINRRDKGEKSE